MAKKKNRITEEKAREIMARGGREAPRGYCRRCWKTGTVRRAGRRPTRCDMHDRQIAEEEREQREHRAERDRAELEAADRTFTAMKWLARETGAGYENSPEELNSVVYGAFWDAMPETGEPTQEQVDEAFRAGIRAFEEYTGTPSIPAACPSCGDQDRRSRSGNDFTCRACGWTAVSGTFGAVYIGMNVQHDGGRRAGLLRQLKEDYGYNDPGWERAVEILSELTDEEIESQLAPSETKLRLTWVTCNSCGNIHEDLEPLDRPEYRRALEAARARDTRA